MKALSGGDGISGSERAGERRTSEESMGGGERQGADSW